MIKVDITGSGKGSVINLPTTISEVSVDYLTGVTSDVRIEANYALVALCISDKLSTLCVPSNKKAFEVKGVSIFVRANDPNKYLDVLPGEKLIAANTDIMMGIEVTAPKNVLSPSKVAKLVTANKELLTKIYSYTEPVWLVTFKLVPINTIHGSYKNLTKDEIEEQAEYCKWYLV